MKFTKPFFQIFVWIIAAVTIVLLSASTAGFSFGKTTAVDWVYLLIIPVSFAGAVLLFNRAAIDRESIRLRDQQNEDVLQQYIAKVTEMRRTSQEFNKEDLAAIKTLTFSALRMIDGQRKAHILKLLFDLRLITYQYVDGEKTEPLIRMKGADFSNVCLQDAVLYVRDWEPVSPDSMVQVVSEVDLSGADLRGANLEGANLYRAHLRGANLQRANLRGVEASMADCVGADFRNARLQNIKLGDGKLQGAKFANANCYSAFFVYAICFISDDTSYEGPFLDQTDFSGADLRYANFFGAKITPEQIRTAKKFWKTRLPDGSPYDGIHPLFAISTESPSREAGMGLHQVNLVGGMCGCKKAIRVDRQRIIFKLCAKTTSQGKPILFDANEEVLKVLWREYENHRVARLSRRFTLRWLYIMLEFAACAYPAVSNYIQKKVYEFVDDIKYWKRYKKIKGLTIRG